MCVIIHKPVGTELSEDTVRQCWARNKDGAGFVSLNEDLSFEEHEKGIMNLEAFLAASINARSINRDSIFHLRINSRGGVNAELTHPFPLKVSFGGKTHDAFLFHNGTADCFNALPVNTSDSMFLANLISDLSWHTATTILSNLNENGYGRFVLTVPGYEHFLLGDNESEEKDGLWFSNTRHENFFHPQNKVTAKTFPASTAATTKPTQTESFRGGTTVSQDKQCKFDFTVPSIFFKKKDGSTSSMPSREDLIFELARFYFDDKLDTEDLNLAEIAMVKVYPELETLDLRWLKVMAKFCHESESDDPIGEFRSHFTVVA